MSNQENKNMISILTPFFALLLSASFILMGNGLQGTLLPVRASLESFSAIQIGILGSSYFLGFAAGCIFGPRIVRRVGHIRTFTAMATIASCVVLAHAMVVSPVIWWLLRAVTGVCLAVLYMVIESWLNERATNENRGMVFSVYTIINLTVVTIGQMMLTFAETNGFLLFSLASILVSLAAVPVALSISPEPAPIASVKVDFKALYRTSPVGVMGCLAVGLANGSFWALAPVFAQGETINATTVALFMSVTVIAGAVGQWPLGRWSDRVDRRRVIAFACIGAALLGIALAVIGPTAALLLLPVSFVYGLFAFPLYALSVAHTNDYAEESKYVEVACGLLLVYAIGAVFGPIVASITMRLVGPGGLFAFTSIIHASMAFFAIYRMQRRHVTPENEHISFADALRMTNTVSNIDPTTHLEKAEKHASS